MHNPLKQLQQACLATVMLVTSVAISYADVSGDLGNFFTAIGFEGNVTSPHAYQGQEAGYYSGGGLFLRNQSRNIQIMHVDLPSFDAGCGGIDLFSGGLSFINAKEFVEFGKQVMNNAVGYATHLALQTAVPEIAHLLQSLQDLAQKVNSSNLNSCEMAESLVGSVWPKTRRAQQQVCQDMRANSNLAADWTRARWECSTGKELDSTMEAASHDDKYKNEIVKNKNLLWDVITRNGFLRSDKQLAEFFMSLSGTIVFDEQGKASNYPSLADNKDLLKALMYGGDASIYHCDTQDKCLKISTSTVTISAEKSLVAQVNTVIKELMVSVREDSTITEKEKGFLANSSIPVLKFITVLASLGLSQSMQITQYSEIIAEDLLTQYLNEALKIIKNSLAATDVTPELQKELVDKVNNAEQVIQRLQQNAYASVQDTLALIRNMQFLEQQVTTELSNSMKGNIGFGSE